MLIGLAPSSLVGSAAVAPQYLAGNANSITLAILRWDTGFFLALPVTLLLRAEWRHGALAAGGRLSVCFFGLFSVLYHIAIGYTTAARASLALSTCRCRPCSLESCSAYNR